MRLWRRIAATWTWTPSEGCDTKYFDLRNMMVGTALVEATWTQ